MMIIPLPSLFPSISPFFSSIQAFDLIAGYGCDLLEKEGVVKVLLNIHGDLYSIYTEKSSM